MLCFASELLRVKTHAGLLFTHKELTRLTQDKFDAFARHSHLVHEVTDTNRWAQNSSSHGYVFATFKHQLLTNRMRNGVKTHNCCMNIFYSIPNNRGCDVLVQFPFKESWESLQNKNKPTKCAAESKFSKLRNSAVHELKMTKFGHNTISIVAIPNKKEEGQKREEKNTPSATTTTTRVHNVHQRAMQHNRQLTADPQWWRMPSHRHPATHRPPPDKDCAHRTPHSTTASVPAIPAASCRDCAGWTCWWGRTRYCSRPPHHWCCNSTSLLAISCCHTWCVTRSLAATDAGSCNPSLLELCAGWCPLQHSSLLAVITWAGLNIFHNENRTTSKACSHHSVCTRAAEIHSPKTGKKTTGWVKTKNL